jgi:citrate lyase synthetase
LVSHEAGNAYVRLVDQDRSRLKAAEKMALEEVKAGLKKVKNLRVGPITPL